MHMRNPSVGQWEEGPRASLVSVYLHSVRWAVGECVSLKAFVGGERMTLGRHCPQSESHFRDDGLRSEGRFRDDGLRNEGCFRDAVR